MKSSAEEQLNIWRELTVNRKLVLRGENSLKAHQIRSLSKLNQL